MIGKIFLGVVVAVLILALLRALITGTILFSEAGRTVATNRSDDPAGFWVTFVIGVLTIAFLLWVILL